MKTHQVCQTEIAQLSKSDLDKILDGLLGGEEATQIATVNAEYLIRAEKDRDFQKLLDGTLNLADGIGPIWAANFLARARGKNAVVKAWWLMVTGAQLVLMPKSATQIFPARISGADFWLDICAKCEQNGQSVFVTARADGLSSLEEVQKSLRAKFPKLKVTGCFFNPSPLSGGSRRGVSDSQILQKLQAAKPDVVFCGLGMPAQDFFLAKNLKKSGAKIGIGIGGSFDFLTGKQQRAPRWVQQIGCEWAWRLVTRPNRWHRIWTATGVWVGLVWEKSK